MDTESTDIKLESVEQVIIPPNHIKFASEVADLADKYGISSFKLNYVPDWRNIESAWEKRRIGEANIYL